MYHFSPFYPPRLLFLTDGAQPPEDVESFARVFNIFDGNNTEAVESARALWRHFKTLGGELHYWQQDITGRWTEK